MDREELIRQRKAALEEKKKERISKMEQDTLYKYNRDEMINRVSKIMLQHILYHESKIKQPSEGAMLFHENNFRPERWRILTPHGFSATLPFFL